MKPAAAKLPRVIANFAVTADGKVSTRNYTPSLFTSRKDKRRLLEIRALGDAVLVGRGTVAADAMTMGLPNAALQAERVARGQAKYPRRVIISNSGRIDPKLRVFRSAGGPVHVLAGNRMPATRQRAFAELGVDVRLAAGPEVDLRTSLAELHRDFGVRTVICEGGAGLFRSLMALDLVGEIRLTWCATIFGGAKAPTMTGPAGPTLEFSVPFRLVALEPGGDGEVFLTYRRKRR